MAHLFKAILILLTLSFLVGCTRQADEQIDPNVFLAKAQETGDVKYCDQETGDDTFQVLCYASVAETTKSLDVCKRLPNTSVETAFGPAPLQYLCYRQLLEFGNPTSALCDRFEFQIDKDLCGGKIASTNKVADITKKALEKQDASICKEIDADAQAIKDQELGELKKYAENYPVLLKKYQESGGKLVYTEQSEGCVFAVTQALEENSPLCPPEWYTLRVAEYDSQAGNSLEADYCIWEVAVTLNKLELCESITEPLTKDNCEAGVQP